MSFKTDKMILGKGEGGIWFRILLSDGSSVTVRSSTISFAVISLPTFQVIFFLLLFCSLLVFFFFI